MTDRLPVKAARRRSPLTAADPACPGQRRGPSPGPGGQREGGGGGLSAERWLEITVNTLSGRAGPQETRQGVVQRIG